jgi:hypothetical protein
MKIARLSISEPLGTSEWVHYHLPVRIGPPLQNDGASCSANDLPVHLELDWANDRLILRDLGTPNPILVRIAGAMQLLRGNELTTAATDIEFAIAGVWMRVSVEERSAHPIAEAAQAAVDQLVGCCTHARAEGERNALVLLAALERSTLALRGSLQADRERTEIGRSGEQDEVTAAITRWTQASVSAISVIMAMLQRANDRDA